MAVKDNKKGRFFARRKTKVIISAVAIIVVVIIASESMVYFLFQPYRGQQDHVSTILPADTIYIVGGSSDHAGGHVIVNFTVNSSSALLQGNFLSYLGGVTTVVSPQAATIYLLTDAELKDISNKSYVTPTVFLYSTGQTKSASFSWLLSRGSYHLFIEGDHPTNINPPLIPLEFEQAVLFPNNVTLATVHTLFNSINAVHAYSPIFHETLAIAPCDPMTLIASHNLNIFSSVDF